MSEDIKMLAKKMLVTQFGYNVWANERILDQAEGLNDKLLNEESVVEERSLLRILAHMAQVERVWRLLAETGRADRDQLPGEKSLQSVDDIRTFLAEEQYKITSYLAGLSEDDLAAIQSITRWDGHEIKMARWHMFSHLLLHSMQHRSEAAVILTSYDRSPGNIDLVYYVLAD